MSVYSLDRHNYRTRRDKVHACPKHEGRLGAKGWGLSLGWHPVYPVTACPDFLSSCFLPWLVGSKVQHVRMCLLPLLHLPIMLHQSCPAPNQGGHRVRTPAFSQDPSILPQVLPAPPSASPQTRPPPSPPVSLPILISTTSLPWVCASPHPSASLAFAMGTLPNSLCSG